MTTVHDSFTIERNLAAKASRVFRAFADPAAKALWFTGPTSARQEDVSFDFREGGRESMTTVLEDGTRIGYHATYTDIVPDERIVYTYEMTINDRRISVSVASVEVTESADGSTLRVTDHGIYLDGLDEPANRVRGTEDLMTALGESLTKDI